MIPVNLALWVGGSFLPICMLVATYIKRNRMTLFFERMREYKIPLKGMIQGEKTLSYSRKLYFAYICLTLLGCGFVTNLIIRDPKNDISILSLMEREPTTTEIALACCFQSYIVIIKNCAIVFIEVLCCSLAKCLCNTMNAIRSEMQKSLDASQKSFSKDNKIRAKNIEMDPYVRKVSEGRNNTLHNVMYPVIPSGRGGENNGTKDLTFSLEPYSTTSGNGYYNNDCKIMEGTGPIIVAIKRYSCLLNMQRLMNCIFGQLLILDTAFLVFMSCLVLFLQINYMGAGNVDEADAIIFTIHFSAFLIRTIIVFMSLGAVYDNSICFNGIVTSALMEAKNPNPMDVNMILAHLSTNSGNPMAFSAGGFFTFSKSSLLAVMSGIMTYVVFLLQAKN